MLTKCSIAINAVHSISLPAGQLALVRSLFECSSGAVQLDDTEGHVIFADGAWLSLFQVDAADAKWAKLVKGRPCKGEQLGIPSPVSWDITITVVLRDALFIALNVPRQ